MIAATDYRIASTTAGIDLYVRNKRLAGMDAADPDKIVLFVHGATYPGSAVFDHAAFDSGSWLDYLAAHGFDAYLFDVRGYGHSFHPSMPKVFPEHGRPYARTAEAQADLAAVVEFIRARNDNARLNLIGWSWGTALAGGFTATNNEMVRHLVMFAPLWLIRNTPSLTMMRWAMSGLPPLLSPGASLSDFRLVPKLEARQRWVRGLVAPVAEQLIPQAEFDRWWNALFNIQGNPGDAGEAVLAPNGVIADLMELWSTGRPTYEPERIRVPTQLLQGEWDVDTPAYMAQELFYKLQQTPYKRLEVLARGTHSMVLELNRIELYHRSREFLESQFV
ncbi:alpha/beta hydrolase (plasmid) [Cupriavidus basilensis]